MPRPFSPDSPDREEIQLRVMDEHVTLTRFTDYTFDSDFLTPADGFQFTMADYPLPEKELAALKVGARVALTVNGIRVGDGHIDSVEIKASKGAGVSYAIHGRDRLALAVDTGADPTTQFKAGATLAEVLVQLFTPFGWTNPDVHFVIDNAANRAASTGGDRGIKMTKGTAPRPKKRGGGFTKGVPPKPLKNFILHILKPHNHEAVFDFAKRISQRFGLWIWASADGETLIIGKPDFDQEPLYQLRRKADGTGNIEEGTVKYDFTDQPTIVFADGFSGGGEYGKGRMKVHCVNPYFGFDEDGFILDDLLPLIAKQPDSRQITLVTQPFKRRTVNVPLRPIYLHDDESKTEEQLEAYIKREMALLTRKALAVHYTVEGHGQYDEDGIFTAWAVDTVVDVQDEVGGIAERMYVLGVHFEKSRHGGTSTKLDLVRLNSIQF